MKKYEELLKEAEEREDEKLNGLGVADFLGGLGGAISGRGIESNNKAFESIRKNIQDQESGKVKEKFLLASEEEKLKNEQGRDQEKQKREQELYDPSSSRSMAFRGIIEKSFPEVAKAYGDNWNHVAAIDQESIFKPLQLKENIESRKEQARILSQQRQDNLNYKAQEKEEKERSKVDESTYRYNILKQNANALKDSVKNKGTFELFGNESDKQDSLVYQMAVDYAKLVDPDSVAREGEVAAAQKYMLPFKKHGGLSTTNNTAIAQIDEYLKGLDNRVQARNNAKGSAKAGNIENPNKSIVKKQYNPARDLTKIIYSDGTEDIVQGKK